MLKKRVLIYGNQKSFSKFLKSKFQNILMFDVCKNFKYLNEELNVYEAIVFVIYTEEDLLDFLKVYRKGIPLVVCSFNNRLINVFANLNDIFLIDTSSIRSEILNQLNRHFKKIILNVEMGNRYGLTR